MTTHVLSWTPPLDAHSVGQWAVQSAAEWADGDVQRITALTLNAPADLPEVSLASWAADRLGFPVELERACAFEEPVFYVSADVDFAAYYAELEADLELAGATP